MKRWTKALGLAGALGTAGLLVPAVASPQDEGGHRGGCEERGAGMHGRRAMRGMMEDGGMMGEGRLMGRGLGPVWRLELTDPQRTQLTRISDALRKAHWATMGKMIDAGARLRDLQAQPQPDPKQVGAAFGDVSKLRQEMLEATVRARNEARTVLTPDQRQQLDKWRQGGPPEPGAGSGQAGPDAPDERD